MKSSTKNTLSNEKEKEKEKEDSINLNQSSDDENKDEDNSSNEGEEQEKNDDKKFIPLFIHLTLITKLVKKENGEYPCICHNLSKEDVLEDNNNNILINNSNNKTNINNSNINSASSFLEEEIIPNIEIPITSDKKIFMKDIISKLKYLGYPTTGALFSVFIKTAFEYVYFGSDPIDPNIFLDETLVDFDDLKIKILYIYFIIF